MYASNNNPAPKGLRGWWRSPPRSGPQLIIAPWEYRHLRAFASVRITSGIVLASLGLVTLSFGGNDWKTYGWTMAFLAAAAAHLAFASWELRIARSTAAELDSTLLVAIEEPPPAGAEGGSNSSQRWRRRELNPGPQSREEWRLRA
jgi:hypothetical protein